MIGMSEAVGEGEARVAKSSGALCFFIPAETFAQDYYVDLASLATPAVEAAEGGESNGVAKTTAGEEEVEVEEEEAGGKEATEADGEGGEQHRQRERRRQRRRRRRDEMEDYDLDDPFIDDDDVPSGFSLAELLAAAGEGEEQTVAEPEEGVPVSVKRSDYYVWKGRLPERELDPLWEEKIKASQRGRKGKGKSSSKGASDAANKGPGSRKRKAESGPKDQAAGGSEGGTTQPSANGVGSSSPRRSKKARPATLSAAGKEKKGSKKKEVVAPKPTMATSGAGDGPDRSIRDRINALGDFEEEPMVEVAAEERRQQDLPEIYVSPPPIDPQRLASRQTPATGGAAGGEERMRKKIDSTTPFLELEHRLAMEAFSQEAQRTAFSDPKRFPSNLRPFCCEAVVTGLRMQEKKTSLPDQLVASIAAFLPFSEAALEKLIRSKIVPLHRDELRTRVIPELLEGLEREARRLAAEQQSAVGATTEVPAAEGGTAAQQGKRAKWNERTRELVLEAIRCELDWHALDRLHRAYAEEGAAAGKGGEAFSEMNIRKAMYPRLAACWPEGEMSTIELGKEYSACKRRAEMRKLKEHGVEIVPQLIPIKARVEEKKGGDAPEEAVSRTAEAAKAAESVETAKTGIESPVVGTLATTTLPDMTTTATTVALDTSTLSVQAKGDDDRATQGEEAGEDHEVQILDESPCAMGQASLT